MTKTSSKSKNLKEHNKSLKKMLDEPATSTTKGKVTPGKPTKKKTTPTKTTIKKKTTSKKKKKPKKDQTDYSKPYRYV